MKSFIFKEELKKKSKMYGWCIITCKIYQIKDNKPTYLCSVDYNTASTRGNTSEVMGALIDNGYITKNEVMKQTDNINYYTQDYINNKNEFIITEI